VELFDVSLLAVPAGVVLAIVAALSLRSGWSLLTALFGGLIGGLLGRLAWELFANRAVGFQFGSEFEGFDWVAGFASVGVLVGRSWAQRSRRIAGGVRRSDDPAAKLVDSNSFDSFPDRVWKRWR
jgi:hypothetical protein